MGLRKGKNPRPMKKLILILAAFFISPIAGLTQSKVWLELDGIYWQKYGLESYGDANNLFRGTVRPWLGLNVGKSWSMGLMGDYSSYRSQEQDFAVQSPIYGPSQDGNGDLEVTGYLSQIFQLGRKNEVMSVGLFLRKDIFLGQKISMNLSFFSLSSGREEGQFEVYPGGPPSWSSFWPCPNCLTVIAGPIISKFEEKTWRAGLDVGFSYELKSWISLGLKANALQFVKSTFTPILNDSNDNTWIPVYYNQLPYGDRHEFGSGIAREGVRFSVQFRPF